MKRALAALSVLVVHVGLFSEAFGTPVVGPLLAHLNIGVTIFFLISGFLLYRPFVASRRGGPARPSVARYGWRRLLRIYPAYWLALTVLVLLPATTGVAGGDWLNQYAMLGALPVAQGEGASCVVEIQSCGLAHTWSLTVEATFYAALPPFALAVAALGRRKGGGWSASWPASELGVIAAAAVVSVTIAFSGPSGTASWVAGSFAGYLFWFGLGMALAAVSVHLEGRPAPAAVELIRRRPAAPWALAGVTYVIFSLLVPATPFLLLSGDRLLTHLCFGVVALLLLPAIFGEPGRGVPDRLLANPVIAWLGLVSYGIFLWHYAFALYFDELGFLPLLAVTLAGAVACAAVSYYLLERPLLRLKDLGRDRPPPRPRLATTPR